MKNLLKKTSLFLLSFLVLVSSNLTILAPSARAQGTCTCGVGAKNVCQDVTQNSCDSGFSPSCSSGSSGSCGCTCTSGASTWYNVSPVEWYMKVYDEKVSPSNQIFGERYTAAQVQWIIYSLATLPLNVISGGNTSLVACIMNAATKTILIQTCSEGVVGLVGKIVGLFDLPKIKMGSIQSPFALVFNTENRQISGIAYTKDIINKLNPVQKVQAQTTGFGFNALGTVRDLWKGTRNIAYVLFVLVSIIFAFMIMFRVKISPQIVISVQSALPKIIIALILVTFSYAIAGFIVDLMYVVIGLFASFLNLAGFSYSIQKAYWLISGVIPVVTGLFGSFLIFFYMFAYDFFFLLAIVFALIETFYSFSIFGLLASVVMIFILVWLLILLFWYSVKIPYVLGKALIQIYLSVIVAPLQIALGTLVPQIGFGAWLKGLIANLLVFPVTGLLFYLAFFFLMFSWKVSLTALITENIWAEILEIFGFKFSAITPGNLWSPPLLASGDVVTPILFILMSFGIIVLIPKATELVKSFIMGEKFSFGTAMGEAMAPVRSIWGMTGAPVVGSYQRYASERGVKNIQDWVNTRIANWEESHPGREVPKFIKDRFSVPVPDNH